MGALRFPETFRKSLGVTPSKQTDVLEGAAAAWLGFGPDSLPVWLQADARLTPAALRALLAPRRPVELASFHVPEVVQLPDGRPLVSVLSGEDPYVREGECNDAKELRLGLYLVKGKQATRAVEWPAVSCALGRVLSVVVDEEGALTLGYSHGASINFAWSGDHFERTEIGKR